MDTARHVLTIVLLVVAAYVVVMNWGCVIVNARNARRGTDRHHSTVPLVSLALTVVAWLITPKVVRHWLFAIPALDVANWLLLWLPFWVILGGPKRIATAGSSDESDEPADESDNLNAVNDVPS